MGETGMREESGRMGEETDLHGRGEWPVPSIEGE